MKLLITFPFPVKQIGLSDLTVEVNEAPCLERTLSAEFLKWAESNFPEHDLDRLQCDIEELVISRWIVSKIVVDRLVDRPIEAQQPTQKMI